MNDRWHIFKDGKALGPYSAAKIREQLREGDLDPFDLVAREGSEYRRELVEVDELFATSKVAYEHPFESASRTQSQGDAREMVERLIGNEAKGKLPGGFIPPEEVLEHNAAMARGPSAFAATQVSANDEGGSGGRRQPGRRRDPKQYNLRDLKGRVLGPLSANDIQILFYKGVIGKTVKVSKRGGSGSVPVDKFVAVLSSSLSPRGQGAHPVMLSSQQRVPALQRLAMAHKARLESVRVQRVATMLLVIAASIMLIFAAWLAYRKGAGVWVYRKLAAITAPADEHDRPEPAKNERNERKKPAKKPPTGALPRPAGAAPSPGKMPEKAEKREKAIKSGDAASPAKTRDERQREVREAQAAQAAQARRDRAKAVPPAARQKTSVTSKAAFVPTQARPKAAQARPSGPTVPGLTDGTQVTNLGPMRYATAEVAKCEGPCAITFTGAGGSVTGRFFKDGFGEVLAAKRGSAIISGIVRKGAGGTTILINDVR